jgi:hypothetical protein
MAYLMRKFQAPLKEVIRYMLIRTRGEVKPNNEFLAQLMDYEVEILGKSSFEDESSGESDTEPVLTIDGLGLFLQSQGELDIEEGQKQLFTKLRSLILVNKWQEVASLSEQHRDETFEPFPIFQIILRRAIYQAVSMQMNFVVEKVPTPTHPTTLLISTYIENTTKALTDFLPNSPESGYLDAFRHAISYTLGVSNVGVGSIFIDHLTQKIGAAYKKLHSGKPISQSSPSEPSTISAATPTQAKDQEDSMDSLFGDLRTHAKIVFGLFQFLHADPSLVSYLEQYETSLANRLALFLPKQHTPTHAMLALEDEIASLIPHPVHMDKVKKMLSDINKVSELSRNWETSQQPSGMPSASSPTHTTPKLEVAVLDSNAWPLASLTKSYEGCTSVNSIPMTILPQEVYPAWDSFKHFVQPPTLDPSAPSNKLILLPHLGDAQMTASLGGKLYTLEVTTPMMLLLCCFNDNEGASLSLADLRSQLNLPSKLLAQTLFSLSQPRHQLLTKTIVSTDPIVKESDTFTLNEKFTSKLRSFKVPNLKYPPSKDN